MRLPARKCVFSNMNICHSFGNGFTHSIKIDWLLLTRPTNFHLDIKLTFFLVVFALLFYDSRCFLKVSLDFFNASYLSCHINQFSSIFLINTAAFQFLLCVPGKWLKQCGHRERCIRCLLMRQRRWNGWRRGQHWSQYLPHAVIHLNTCKTTKNQLSINCMRILE